jgi:hypothetical protein
MNGRFTIILTSFLAGLLGGTVPRLFTTQSAFAQNPDEVLQKYKDIAVPATKVLRAERIELVNNKGKVLAVLEASYSQALPAGAAKLTFTDRDELMGQDRKVVRTTAGFSMSMGKDDYLRMGPGGDLSFHDAAGGVSIGKTFMPNRPPTLEHGLVIFDPRGVVMVNSRELRLNDRNGMPVAVVPQ